MLTIENYLGEPHLNTQSQTWELNLDEDITLNLRSICELVLSIFDAQSCRIFGKFEQSFILITQSGDVNSFSDKNIDDINHFNSFTEKKLPTITCSENNKPTSAKTINNANVDNNSLFHIVSPITLPTEDHFGFIEIYRYSEGAINTKEKAILKLIERDITNHVLQHRHIFEADKSRELQQLISKNNKDWIFVKDKNFKIVYGNDAFISLYPKDKQDKIIGYTTIEEYDEKEAELFLKQDKIAFEQGESTVIEDIHMPNGGRMIVETVKRRFNDDTGKAYILCICRDITEKENLIRQLKKATKDLDDFTSIASHDLKSPLNAIKRLLEWIEEDCKGILPEESLENLNLVVSRANRMHTLLDDLLNFAKIGREDIKFVEISMVKLFDDLSNLIDLPDTFSLQVDDATLTVPLVPFETVMLNIVSNAIKHNDKQNGTINITTTSNRHYYIIKISDNGPGIEPKYFQRVFQLFQTLKPRDELEGTGLGLSVVVKHLNQFGGKVEIDSDGINGTTFTVMWPKQKPKGKV